MPRKTRKTLLDLVAEIENRDQLALALTDAWAGLDSIDIVAQVVAFAFEECDEDDDEDDDEHDWMDIPEPGEPVPPDLLEPKTLVHAVCKLEHDAYADGRDRFACAAATIRQALRCGDILQVAQALVEVAEEIEEE